MEPDLCPFKDYFPTHHFHCPRFDYISSPLCMLIYIRDGWLVFFLRLFDLKSISYTVSYSVEWIKTLTELQGGTALSCNLLLLLLLLFLLLLLLLLLLLTDLILQLTNQW
jgi:hypothetical protein